MNTLTPYQISQTTGLFIDALKALQDAKEAYFTALQSLYGEDAVTDIYCDNSAGFEAAERQIADIMRESIIDNLSRKKTDNIQVI